MRRIKTESERDEMTQSANRNEPLWSPARDSLSFAMLLVSERLKALGVGGGYRALQMSFGPLINQVFLERWIRENT